VLTGVAFAIDRVEVLNRVDDYRSRLDGALVLVDGRKCGALDGLRQQTVSCSATIGRRVRIQQNPELHRPVMDRSLNLCEVQVYGEWATGGCGGVSHRVCGSHLHAL
jgi:hypothetical protein